ncbi:ferredoxin family protein [Alicyclobacillus sp. ALC3]|uniref:ferredoxin family protein n=1 Tax=Alicyclobacillus sp. ALC3 TaxID=2796143 RepID=UPI002379E52D|nr:4Fe-4S dicluster domain-containing protein [Alicyclobacillus sp. ALC3]
MSGTLEQRLYSIRYKTAEKSHLTVRDESACLTCDKDCNFFCPADVYLWDPERKQLNVAYENCIECGTCRLACPSENIEWVYPTGGYGITYKFG